MKNKLIIPGLALIAISLWSCGPADTTTKPEFTFTVTADANPNYAKLPPLQSFIFENYKGNWLMFSGRTNGFHNFSEPGQDFPKLMANQFIFVFNPTSGQLDSIAIPSYGGDTANVFLSTNLAHTAKDGYLYACGGYGVLSGGDSARTTYSYFMKMQMDSAIAAVQSHNASSAARFKKSIIWGQSPMVCSTGGELYLLPDNNFYMCVGHKFTGSYIDSTAVQQYVDKINVFSVSVANNSLVLTSSANGPITDGLPDSTTQFRRRDLVVAPNVLANGTDIGLAIYGGVFTYGGVGSPFNTGGNPFPHPIYMDYHQAPYYKVDPYSQPTNIYSTAFLSMYDSGSQSMITSLFGGLGDSVQNFNAANWSKTISSNIRCFANNKDTTTTYANVGGGLPAYIGSESIFIPDASVTYYQNYGDYKIIDYSSLTNGQTVGRIYGGIVCTTLPIGNNNAITSASNVVYKVVFNKLEPLQASK
ncbi:MAG: hypothetical protein JWP12_1221 [Bacteroidetes bacterium]|nr:hypothetical protein [Bacteroidota bacterium]